MITNILYKDYYTILPKVLVLKYPELDFKKHCYMRIALDNVIGTRWEIRISKPIHKHLSAKQRALVIEYLNSYLEDKMILLTHNMISLAYRGKL